MSSMFACSDEPESPGSTNTEKKNLNNATIQLDGTSAGSNGTAVLNNLTLEVPSTVLAQNANPAALADALKANTNTSMTFTDVVGAKGNFTMTSPTASGTLTIASCTFTITAPVSLAGEIHIKDCAIKVTANGVQPGGSGIQGTAVLVLNGVSSKPVTVTVAIASDGTVIVNDHATKTVVTGTSGS
jgi:hypothetical protein